MEAKAKHGRGLLQVYKVIHVSNGISEILGHIINEMVNGPRLRMGVMMMENLLRLHNLPPLESAKADKWFERLVHYWIMCGGQQAMCKRSNKRRLADPTVLPAGKHKASSDISKALASRRMRHKLYASHARSKDD